MRSITSPHLIKHSRTLLILAGSLLLTSTLAAASLPITPLEYASGLDAALITPEATDSPLSPRLLKSAQPLNPTMADKGGLHYWNDCISCHGERGQGLTDDWRKSGFGKDMDCWDSNCHASNSPGPKFNFPAQVPPLIGKNALLLYTTARDLKDHIKSAMPWWDPGSLSETDSWNLTAFLLRENGVLPASAELNVKYADASPVHLPIFVDQIEKFGQSILFTFLSLASISLIFGRIFNHSKHEHTPSGSGRPNFFYHLHPPTIPAPQARWRYTLGAGGLAVFLTIVVIITGALEMFFYAPTPAQAGPSIQMITFLVPFGGFIRGLHFWASQALVIVSGIHLLRVIFTGAYHSPRRFNFLLGLALFVLVVFMDFTGYILRWDNGIHWALIVGTNLLESIPVIGLQIYRFVVGGLTPGPATLIRFYAWHIFGLTIFSMIILAWHIFRVRRDGGISAPDPDQRSDQRRITRHELVRREALAMLIASTTLILVASLIPAPLSAPILDAGMPLNPEVRAPWFFLWVQQLLRLGDAFWMGVAIPVGVIILLACLPYLNKEPSRTHKGEWFPVSDRIPQIIAGTLALAWFILTILELLK